MPSSRSFLFDIGNVICSFDFTAMSSRLLARSSNPEAALFTGFASIKDAYETGHSEDREFVSTAIKSTGFTGDPKEFIRIWCEIFTENTKITGLIKALAQQGHELYLLSNTNGLHLDYLQRKFPAFSYFSGGIYSHKVGILKPHEQIYRVALEQFSLNAEETLYIDDLPENIQTGRLLGLTCHRYLPHRHDDLIKWLAAAGISLC